MPPASSISGVPFGCLSRSMSSSHPTAAVQLLGPGRFVWNFFRLENEHLNNCGKFRAVRDISVAPIDAGNQALLVRMMDEPCGVVNRGGPAGPSKTCQQA
ncbi:hypothetical protein MTO96_015100 [Rhipicephalus appendiculatus]